MTWLIRQKQKHNWLLKNGQIIQAHYEGIQCYQVYSSRPKMITSLPVDYYFTTRKYFLKVVCSWTDPRTQFHYTFFSAYLNRYQKLNPLENIQHISVIINPKDPEQYWVDLSGLGISVSYTWVAEGY
jgi:hypothetical protein